MLAPVYPHAYGPTNFLWFCDAALLLTVAGMWMESSLLFDPHLPLFTRGLSLCHAWLPVLLVWLLFRVGYDRRALNYWIILAAMLMAVGYLFTPPAGAHPVDPNQPINPNHVYGFNDQQPQRWVNQHLYVVLWLVAFLPTHLVLRRIFALPPPAGLCPVTSRLLSQKSAGRYAGMPGHCVVGPWAFACFPFRCQSKLRGARRGLKSGGFFP